MEYAELPKNINKSIKFDDELSKKIDDLRRNTERTFSQQVRLMLKEYIKIKES